MKKDLLKRVRRKKENMKEIISLFLLFFKIGLFTFGGGYAMIPSIKEEVVEKRHYISNDELLDIIAIAESTPGPTAINLATYIGYKKDKFIGSLFATLGVILPSFIIIVIISIFYHYFMSLKAVKYAFIGINAAVSILIISTSISMIVKMKKKVFNIVILVLTIVAMVLVEIFNLNFSSIYCILIGGILGIFVNALNKAKEVNK